MPNNFPFRVSSNKPTREMILEIQKALSQLWNKVTTGEREITNISSLVSNLQKTDTFHTNSINSLYTHSSKMPDTSGSNPDHDRRYIPRAHTVTEDSIQKFNGTKLTDSLLSDDGSAITSDGGRVCNTTRIIDTDSPYDALATDHVIFADTDGGAITINLPAGVDGTHYRIINCGSSGNDVSVDPDGTEQVRAGGAGTAYALTDGNILDIYYDSTEGWW